MPKRWVVGGAWAIFVSVAMLTCTPNAIAEEAAGQEKITITDVILSALRANPCSEGHTAQPKPAKIIISEVNISGNQRIAAEQIKAHLHTHSGKVYDSAIVDDDVRELYKTGQFSNITTYLQTEGTDRGKVYFIVRETPNMVQKVTFRGAKHIKYDELLNLTGVRPNAPLNPTLNRLGCERILEKYGDEGRPLSNCQLIKGGDVNDTEVAYQITEGPKVKVCDIQLTGNRSASAAMLRKRIPLQVGGTYNRTSTEAGIDELYAFYRDLGYQDARISLEARRDPAAGKVTLIYHIHEGERSQPHSSKSKP